MVVLFLGWEISMNGFYILQEAAQNTYLNGFILFYGQQSAGWVRQTGLLSRSTDAV